MKADVVKCRPFTCVNGQGPQFCLSASRSLRRLIPKSKSRENAVYRCKAIVVNKPHRKNTLYQKVLASVWLLPTVVYLIKFLIGNLSYSPCSEPSRTVLLLDVMYTMYARPPLVLIQFSPLGHSIL